LLKILLLPILCRVQDLGKQLLVVYHQTESWEDMNHDIVLIWIRIWEARACFKCISGDSTMETGLRTSTLTSASQTWWCEWLIGGWWQNAKSALEGLLQGSGTLHI
jgi:hypothetical protein